jgi:hypothetical protein
MAFLQDLISGAPEQLIFNTDRLNDPTPNLQNASQHQQFCALQSGGVSPIRTSLLADFARATQPPDLPVDG